MGLTLESSAARETMVGTVRLQEAAEEITTTLMFLASRSSSTRHRGVDITGDEFLGGEIQRQETEVREVKTWKVDTMMLETISSSTFHSPPPSPSSPGAPPLSRTPTMGLERWTT